ncbi:uncharacterized protein EKO05_0006269 [Ascochyta rabiei]|nr:uncharacterized protein EKO05_0006269 [Ascochyta rabiei]UPX15832.1 hypothetical protein EKO05_0006269 [Ascochyta rabiei]
MLSLLFTTLSLLTLSTTALPFSNQAPPTAEQWTIPSLSMHMMTRYTGLPGSQPWPESTQFPSTIAFDVNMPNNHTAHCRAEWANGTLPDVGDSMGCTGEGPGRVRFRMREYTELGHRRPELGFVLSVWRDDRQP